MKTAIIGAGEIGRAIEKLLKDRGEEVLIWDKDESKVPGQKTLQETAAFGLDFLFFCVPSWAMRGAVSDASPSLQKDAIIVSLAKGMESDSKKTMDALLAELLPIGQKFGILSGPMLAEELNMGFGGAGVFACAEIADFEKIKTLFGSTKLKLDYSPDLFDTALVGTLKNIYAFALGIADGLKWGGNQKGWLVSRVIGEMVKIAEMMGAKKEAILSPAGIGDFIATGFSRYSRNHQIGEEIVAVGKASIKSEGLVSIEPLTKILGDNVTTLPILSALEAIVIKRQNAKELFDKLA